MKIQARENERISKYLRMLNRTSRKKGCKKNGCRLFLRKDFYSIFIMIIRKRMAHMPKKSPEKGFFRDVANPIKCFEFVFVEYKL